MKAQWVYHPDIVGMKVLVVRGFWGRLMKSRDFATPHEAAIYMMFLGAMQRRRFNDG